MISEELANRFNSTQSAADLAALNEWLITTAAKTRENARSLQATDAAWEKSPAAAIHRLAREVLKRQRRQ